MPPLPSGSDALSQVAGSGLGAVGAQLRQAREARGLTTETLAERLRIGVEQLQALENAETEHLPEPVFVIAQIRRVAAALQLDIEEPLQALRRSGDLERLPRRTAGPGRTPASPGAGPAAVPSGMRAAAASTPRSAQTGAGRSAPEGATSERATTAPAGNGRGGSHLRRRLSLGAGASLLLLALLWGGWRLRQPSSQGAGANAPSDPAAPPLAPGKAPVTAGAAASPDLPPAAETLELVSPEPSWVEVRRPDGTRLYRGLLNGRQQFPLGQGLEVLAGRPDLVRHRIGRGPSRPLGPISEIRWWSLPPQP